ncbi:MAG: hypothetical protein M1819_005802 [Sarea resinae]|nr:MAG: hypothetical protein M1819_005802 [Sarea resinae]
MGGTEQDRHLPLVRSLLVRSPLNTTPEEVVAQLPAKLESPSLTDALIVFLLTPSFSRWASDDSRFLSKALQHLFEGSSKSKASRLCDALVAVVDRIPCPEEGKLSDEGAEGIAMLVMDSARSLPYPEERGATQSSRRVQLPSSISFQFQPTSSRRENIVSEKSHTVEVPLANTIFQNGRTSTIFTSQWKFASGGSQPERLTRREIGCPPIAIACKQSLSESITYDLPLFGLTEPRQIVAGIGNIVRRLRLGEGNLQSVPASQELEKAFSTYFHCRDIAPQSMTVWALVIPQTVVDVSPESSFNYGDSLKKAAKNDWVPVPPVWNGFISDFLERGAHLHRVLSGGGGWGQKQGLLSLDPDSSYKPSQEPRLSFDSGASVEDEQREALGEVAKPGDYVQFFISPGDSIKPRQAEGETAVSKEAPTTLFEFGTIPSTVDFLLTDAASPTLSDGEENIISLDCFGAFSEKGLGITIDDFTPFGTVEEGLAKDSRTITQTKVDVPYSRLRLALRTKDCN